jgi:hypothetical protein
MSSGIWVRPASLKRLEEPWQPAPGFVETRPGVWEPEGYQRTRWELAAPVVVTPQDAFREYIRSSRSLSYFAFHHAWSVHVDDASRLPVWKKFPRYDYLQEFFHEVQEPTNVHVEKSRQMLMSWAWMVVFLWDIMFKKNWGNMVLSRRKTEVDDGGAVSSHDSLLGKVRHVWLALPPYLQAPLNFNYMVVRHIELNSYVRGEVGTIKAGRGRATKRALMDEAAWLDNSEAIFTGVRQAAKNGTILTSTPNGTNNVFARIRFDKHSTFKRLSFHWIRHPEKAANLSCTCGWHADDASDVALADQLKAHACGNRLKQPAHGPEPQSPWYQHETRDMTPEQVASELDISYEKSRRGRVYAAFDAVRQTFNHQALPMPDGRYIVGERGTYEDPDAYRQRYLQAALSQYPNRSCVVGWDFGVDDPTSLLLGQVLDESTMHIRWLDEFEGREQSWDYYHAFVNSAWAPVVKLVTNLDLIHFGDPSGKNRESDLRSWISNLKSREPRIVIVHEPHVGSMLEWLDFIHLRIRQQHFQVSTFCPHLLDALANYKYPTDKDGHPIAGKHLPVHDQWSHCCDAMRYVYKFRFYSRLKSVDNTVVSNRQVLAVDGDRAKQPDEAVFAAEQQRTRLRYFRQS